MTLQTVEGGLQLGDDDLEALDRINSDPKKLLNHLGREALGVRSALCDYAVDELGMERVGGCVAKVARSDSSVSVICGKGGCPTGGFSKSLLEFFGLTAGDTA